MARGGVVPHLAVEVVVEELFLHCSKAFGRSALWDPASWPAKGEVPSAGEIVRSQHPAVTVPAAEIDAALEESAVREPLLTVVSAVAVDPVRGHQHRGPALLTHDAVVGVPVVVRAPARGEHVAEQQPQRLGVGLVRPDDLAVAVDRDPPPADPPGQRRRRPFPQAAQLDRAVR